MIDAPVYRFSLEQYERLVETGVLREDEPIELLDGKIRAMTPIGPSHVYTVMRLQKRLERQFGEQALLVTQSPIRLPPKSEPQPDIALLKPPAESYRSRLPEAADILLVIEVADSSLEYDRSEKLPIYAAAGIPEVWIVNLRDKQLEVYLEPKHERYGRLTTYEVGTRVAPSAFEQGVDWWS